MADTTGAESTPTTESTAPAATDPNAEPPGYGDVKNEKLVANFDKLAGQLAELLKEKPTPETVEKARKIREQQLEIKAEMDARFEANEALKAQMAEIGEVDVSLPSFEDTPQTIGEGAGIEPATPGLTAVDDDTDAAVLVAASAGAPSAAQMAAARGAQPGSVRAPDTLGNKPLAWVASAASTAVMPGSEMALEQIGKALMQLGRSRAKFGDDGTIVASLPDFDSSRGELLGDSPSRNTQLIREAVEAFEIRKGLRQADGVKRAAICEPFDILREIINPGRSQATPFRDDLPFRGAGRLAFTFMRGVTIASTTDGLREWSDTDQDAVDEDDESTWKPVYDVACGTPVDTQAQELTWGLRFEESTDLSSPEMVAEVLNALMTAEARRSEAYLLRRYDQISSGYTWTTPDLGGLPDLAEIIGALFEKAKYTERLDTGGWKVWLPPGFLTKLKLDKARRGFDSAPTADVLAELRATLPDGITTTELRDISDNKDLDPDTGATTSVPNESIQGGGELALTTAGAAPTALTHDQCQTFRLRIANPSTMLAYSTGRTDTGVMRSPELIRQNRSIMFGREWLGLAKHTTIPQFYVDVTFMPWGARAGLVSADGVDCSS
jgi:hypothetical protein